MMKTNEVPTNLLVNLLIFGQLSGLGENRHFPLAGALLVVGYDFVQVIEIVVQSLAKGNLVSLRVSSEGV